MPHEKGFKTSFVVPDRLTDDVRQCQERIERLFGVRLHFSEAKAGRTDRWIEVYDADSNDVCTKVKDYVKAICMPDTEVYHRCSEATRRSIFEGGQRDVLEREYAVCCQALNSEACTLLVRGSEEHVALALSAIDDSLSATDGPAGPACMPALPAASGDAARWWDYQNSGDAGLLSGSESSTSQPRQPFGSEARNGSRNRLAANLSNSGWKDEMVASSGQRDEVEADDGAEMKILPPSRPKPTRQKGSSAPIARASWVEQDRATGGVTPADSRGERASALALSHGGFADRSSLHADGTVPHGSSAGGVIGIHAAASGHHSGVGTAGGDRRPLSEPSDLSKRRPVDFTSHIAAARAADCDELDIALLLSQAEHDQADRQWTPEEFVRAVRELAQQSVPKDHFSTASTTSDWNLIAESGAAATNEVNPTLAEAARRLPTVLPNSHAAVSGYDTAPLLGRPGVGAGVGYDGIVRRASPLPLSDAVGNESSHSSPLAGSARTNQSSRNATFPPERGSAAVGAPPRFFLAERAALSDFAYVGKLSTSPSDYRPPLLSPSAFSVRGSVPESRSSPAVLSFAEENASGSNSIDTISFALKQGYDPVVVHEVAAQLGRNARIADFMAAIKARTAAASTAAAAATGSAAVGSAAAASQTAKSAKSKNATPAPSNKGTDVLAFAKDCGYSDEEISAVMRFIGDNATPQELLAALKKRSEAVRLRGVADSSSGSSSDMTQFGKKFAVTGQEGTVTTRQGLYGDDVSPRELPTAKRLPEASNVNSGPIPKAHPVRSRSDVISFAKDYGYTEEEINAARQDVGDNATPPELLTALRRRSEASKAAIGSAAVAVPVRRGSDVDRQPSSKSQIDLEPASGGIRGSPLKQGKSDASTATAGNRKAASYSAAVGGSGGGRPPSADASASRDQRITAGAPSGNRRRIVIDGSNVAMFNGDGIFRCRNIQICVNYFLEKGHTDITVVVPQHRRWDQATADAHILEDLQKKDLLVYQPSKKLPNMPSIRPYDDKLILDIAANYDGVVISNDNYKDLLNDTPKRDYIIRNRVIMFTIIGNDMFYINDDPMGKGGPTLEELLTRR